jgi:hypothetical protein
MGKMMGDIFCFDFRGIGAINTVPGIYGPSGNLPSIESIMNSFDSYFKNLEEEGTINIVPYCNEFLPELIHRSIHRIKPSIWHVEVQGERREMKSCVLPLSARIDGTRIPHWERNVNELFMLPAAQDTDREIDSKYLLQEILEPMLERELLYRGILTENRDYKAELIGWIEVV